jgi:hypothetical protein
MSITCLFGDLFKDGRALASLAKLLKAPRKRPLGRPECLAPRRECIPDVFRRHPRARQSLLVSRVAGFWKSSTCADRKLQGGHSRRCMKKFQQHCKGNYATRTQFDIPAATA